MKRRSDYQGWANYETWHVALMWDNDQGSHEYWHERAYQMKKQFGEDARWELAQEMKGEIEDNAPVTDDGFYQTLLWSAMEEINYHELATHYLEGLADYDEGHFSYMDEEDY